MKSKTRIMSVALVFCLFISAFFWLSNKNIVNADWIVEEEISDFESVNNVEMYEDGKSLKNNTADASKDIKKIYQGDNKCRIYDYSNGYSLELPSGVVPDYSLSEFICRYESVDITAIISVENSENYSSMDNYYSDTFSGSLSNESFQQENSVTFNEIVRNSTVSSGCTVDVFRGEKTDLSSEYKAKYSYLYFRSSEQSKTVYRVAVKYKNGYDYQTLENTIKNSFKLIDKSGRVSTCTKYEYPAIPNYWNDETKAYYNYLCNSDTTQWGLYFYQDYGSLQRENYFESQCDENFDLAMYYISMPSLEFNTSFAYEAYSQNKVVVMTLRFEAAGFASHCFTFDVVSGKYDEQLKQLAGQIKRFGHPVIIRMENEFNTNWSTCSGLRSLGDPDWYKDAWKHIYNTFVESGVNNAIFMSNPESEQTSYPKQNWLHYINYLPEKEYIQIIGLTAYNFGEGSDSDKSFYEIYCGVAANNKIFTNWPWVIGEFACSGPNEGVDKCKWIKDMFATIDMFPNIKGAVWFDSTDLNSDGSVLRDFRLTSPSNAGTTFLECIKSAKSKSKTGEWSFEKNGGEK